MKRQSREGVHDKRERQRKLGKTNRKIDLGVDVPAEKFVEAATSEKAQLVGMSALLTTTMPYIRTTIEALEKAGLKGQVKTIIGGACVTQQYADEIGADAYGDNAGDAVEKVKELLGLK